MYVFVPQYLVKDPIKDVEEEEGQREAGPGDSVNLLGSVDEEFPHLLCASAPPARCPCSGVLGGVGRGGQRRGGVVAADLVVFAVAGSGGHGGCRGQPAFAHLPFLFEGGGVVIDVTDAANTQKNRHKISNCGDKQDISVIIWTNMPYSHPASSSY